MTGAIALPTGSHAVSPPRSAPPVPLAERMDRAELAAFYERVAPRLAGYLRGQTRDAAIADDMTQEAFTRVLASRFEPESEEHLTRYLYKTAIHLARDRGRALPRAPLALDDAHEPAARSAPAGLRHDLERAFAQLKPKERQLIWLAHVEELDHKSIAVTLDANPASVRVMLFRARRRLAALLGREEPRSQE
jgi:RNA polymerase sigma-70 factor (ECF subfamily)